MPDPILYAFEAISNDLPRPPLAAVRALMTAGILPKPKGWQSLDVTMRWEIARAGGSGRVDVARVRALAQKIPPRHLRLVAQRTEPDPDHVPNSLARALGPNRVIPVNGWRMLRAMDRSVLASLASNPRLLSKAYDELASRMGLGDRAPQNVLSGLVAHAEVQGSSAAIDRLFSPAFLDGRSLVLAKAAGLRAARRVHEILDLYAESAAGPVELDWATMENGEGILWQAHVSAWDGTPFPGAAMLAVSAASTAVCDMVKEVDPTARVAVVSLREEAWLVGQVEGEDTEAATSLFSHDALSQGGAPSSGNMPPEAWQAGKTVRMDPSEFDFSDAPPVPSSSDVVSSAPVNPVPPMRDRAVSGGPDAVTRMMNEHSGSVPSGPAEVDAPGSHGGQQDRAAGEGGHRGQSAEDVSQRNASASEPHDVIAEGSPRASQQRTGESAGEGQQMASSSAPSGTWDDPIDLPVRGGLSGQKLLFVLVGVAVLLLLATLAIVAYMFVFS